MLQSIEKLQPLGNLESCSMIAYHFHQVSIESNKRNNTFHYFNLLDVLNAMDSNIWKSLNIYMNVWVAQSM